ncbi:hypothetical protein V8E55_002641, partial [Tylopilus felleus]
MAFAHARRHIRGTLPVFFYHPIKCHLPWSQVKTWDKVNAGMIKMDKAEVLRKLTAALHVLFGFILTMGGLWLLPMARRSIVDTCMRDGVTVVGYLYHIRCCAGGARQPRAIEGPGIRPVPF